MIIKKEQAEIKEKVGIKIFGYPAKVPEIDFVIVEVEKGHAEEFYHKTSTFIYYVIEGRGTFYLDGKENPVVSGDMIVVPPNTKIYYLGKMKLVLITTPSWKEEDEVHVRFINL